MIKLRFVTFFVAIVPLFLTIGGCATPPSNTPAPGQQQIDKARDAKDVLEQRNEEQEKQLDEQER